MNKYRLINILNNDDIIVTGLVHHAAIERRLMKVPKSLLMEMVDETAAIDGFTGFDDDLSLFMVYFMLYTSISQHYNTLFESHRHGNPKRYPL